MTKATGLATQSSGKVNEADVLQLIEDALLYMKNVHELSRWVYRRKALPIEEALDKAQAFKELGDKWVEDMQSRLQKLPQGKPPRKRQAHISAFEFMLHSKKNSLGMAVQKFCPCGQKHEPECYQQFKAGIHSLTKMLRKYAPDLVARYDALHPDRAKKARQARAL